MWLIVGRARFWSIKDHRELIYLEPGSQGMPAAVCLRQSVVDPQLTFLACLSCYSLKPRQASSEMCSVTKRKKWINSSWNKFLLSGLWIIKRNWWHTHKNYWCSDFQLYVKLRCFHTSSERCCYKYQSKKTKYNAMDTEIVTKELKNSFNQQLQVTRWRVTTTWHFSSLRLENLLRKECSLCD